MTERELFEAIGHVDDDMILAADAPVKKRRRVVHLHWQQVVSVAACACIVLGGAAVWRSGALRKSSIASEAAMAADVPEAAAETAPAPDMPMLDAAAPRQRTPTRELLSKRTAPLPALLWAWRSAYRSTACCILIRAAQWTAPRTAGLTGSLRQALTRTPSRRRTGARTLVPGIPTG